MTRMNLLDDGSVQRCINDSTALTRARNSGLVLLECMTRSNHLIQEIFLKLENHTRVDSALADEFCRKALGNMKNCTRAFEDSLQPCLSESDMNAVKIYNKLPKTALGHMCTSIGHYIDELNTEENNTCLENQINNLDTCGISLLEEARRLDKTMLALPRFLQSHNGCRSFHEGANCIRAALSHCEDNNLSNIITGAINATVSVLPNCVNVTSIRTK
ncbi:uncharacterized protein [Anabrus simplex]|uniref:uncharacterized protein n=1 Tax=Anabrus simplex TaxID=316456 RepID=UPI0035A2ACB0